MDLKKIYNIFFYRPPLSLTRIYFSQSKVNIFIRFLQHKTPGGKIKVEQNKTGISVGAASH